MSGLQRICKLYGSMKINGVRWVWDYAREIPVPESEMSKEQFAASEKAKWRQIKEHLETAKEKESER